MVAKLPGIRALLRQEATYSHYPISNSIHHSIPLLVFNYSANPFPMSSWLLAQKQTGLVGSKLPPRIFSLCGLRGLEESLNKASGDI